MNKRTIFGCLLGVLIAVFLIGGYGFSSWYHVEKIEVLGTSRYTDDEVKAMVLHGIAAENTFLAAHFLSRKGITDVPFVDSISVTALDRNTIAISVHEKKAVGCFPYLDSFIYFDRNGVFIEGERVRDETVPYFSGILVNNIVQNQKLDIKGTNVISTAVVLSTIFQKNRFMPDDIRFDENYQISLIYENIIVELGQDTNLEEKMTRVLAILPKISGRRGILHAETVNQNSKIITFELEVDAENWDGGYESDGEYTGEGEYNADGEYVGPMPRSAGSAKNSKKEDDQTDEEDTLKVGDNPWNIGLDYLDADQDGINDFTGESLSSGNLSDLSYLDEDGDGYNDYTGEPLPGTAVPENADGNGTDPEAAAADGSDSEAEETGSYEDDYDEYYEEDYYESYDESYEEDQDWYESEYYGDDEEEW